MVGKDEALCQKVAMELVFSATVLGDTRYAIAFLHQKYLGLE